MFKNVHIFSSLFHTAWVVLILRRHILLFMVSASSNGGYVYELCPSRVCFCVTVCVPQLRKCPYRTVSYLPLLEA